MTDRNRMSGSGPPDLSVSAEHSRDGKCIWCKEPTGDRHGPKCVCVCRMVDYDVLWEGEVIGWWRRADPSHWDLPQCEFHKNDGSWCTSNLQDTGEWLDGRALVEAKALALPPAEEDEPGDWPCLCRHVELIPTTMGEEVFIEP